MGAVRSALVALSLVWVPGMAVPGAAQAVEAGSTASLTGRLAPSLMLADAVRSGPAPRVGSGSRERAGVVAGQASGDSPEVTDPDEWWARALLFIVGIPVTIVMVLLEGERLYLLPGPILAVGSMAWNFVAWRRQGYWTPRVIHVAAVLAFLTIAAINLDWVRTGGAMWIQRYVVVVVCTLLPYLVYLVLGGPRYMAKRGRVPETAPGGRGHT